MKIRYWLLAMSFIFLSCGRVADDVEANYGIIPMPNELAPMQGVYVLQGKKTVAVPSGEAAMKVFHYLEDALKNTSVTLKDISETGKADICLSIDNSLPNEAYTLEVSSDRINISSNEINGYNYEENSHLAVASAVARGKGDFGIGIEKVAKQIDNIDFIPLQKERYDLVIKTNDLENPIYKQILKLVFPLL